MQKKTFSREQLSDVLHLFLFNFRMVVIKIILMRYIFTYECIKSIVCACIIRCCGKHENENDKVFIL